MPRRILTSDLLLRAKQRADMVTDDSIDRAEWLSIGSEVFGEMWSEVSILASRYFETSLQFSATGATSYDEPDSHHGTVRIVEVMDDGTERQLRELQPFEEAAYRGHVGTAVGWIHTDDQLYLCPSPASGTFRWYYTAQPTDLSDYDDDDVIDLVCPAGEAFVLWGMAAMAKAKGGKDATYALSKQARAFEQLQVWCANHNLTDVPRRGPIDGYEDDDGRPSWWVD